MEKFIKGDVVILPFLFSNLKGSKRRPTLVLADLKGDDIILCQITSQPTKDNLSVPLLTSDFSSETLPVNSFIRPTRIFTADKNIILGKAGIVKQLVADLAVNIIVDLLTEKH